MPLPYYRIDLNGIPKSIEDHQEEFLVVTPESQVKLRREVERFAIYFRREFRYDFQQFEATERTKPNEKPYTAYLFTGGAQSCVWVGACCFRWREYSGYDPRWGMQWMWLHPYYRGQGILTRVWGKFHELHGNFFCEPPFSPAMNSFLLKRGKCILCWQLLDAPEKVICSQCETQHKK